MVSRGDNQGSEVQQFQIVKHYPPDVRACEILINNLARRYIKEPWKFGTNNNDEIDLNEKQLPVTVNINVKDCKKIPQDQETSSE